MSTSKVDYGELFSFPDADLPIVVTHKGERVIGKVSSAAMCLASPVWKKFIKPPFGRLGSARTELAGNESLETAALGSQESQTAPESQLDFQDDNSDALLLLLRIAHLQFVAIPFTLPYSMLLSMAVLVDQYDCIELVHPWVQHWVADEKVESLKAGQESWLFIACVFGREKGFQTLAEELVRRVSLEDESRLLNSIMPPLIIGTLLCGTEKASTNEMLENIFECRKQEISKILVIPYTVAERLEEISAKRKSDTRETGVYRPTPTECSHKDANCDNLSYGSLILNLLEEELWPRKHADEISICVSRLATILQGLSISKLPNTSSGGYGVYETHKDCLAINMQKGVKEILATKPPTPVLDSLTLHMKTQHRRLNPLSNIPLLDENPSGTTV